MPNLSERRKADRAKMASKIFVLASRRGARVRYQDISTMHPGAIEIRIETERGLSVFIDFDGRNPEPDVFCMPWHFKSGSNARLADSFGLLLDSSVNQHHFQKCTAFATGFDELCDYMALALDAAVEGSAFDLNREKANFIDNKY